jgi:hypothetical protein
MIIQLNVLLQETRTVMTTPRAGIDLVVHYVVRKFGALLPLCIFYQLKIERWHRTASYTNWQLQRYLVYTAFARLTAFVYRQQMLISMCNQV